MKAKTWRQAKWRAATLYASVNCGISARVRKWRSAGGITRHHAGGSKNNAA